MVAVDGSKSAKAAFYTALFMMDPVRDALFIIGVTEKISNYYPHAYIAEKVDSMIQEQAKQETRAILSSYRRLCHAKGVSQPHF